MAKKAKTQQDFVDTMVQEEKKASREVKFPSGNVPYRHKFYALNSAGYKKLETTGEIKKLPGQVQGILKYLASKDEGYESIGPDICARAIEGGFVATKIEPAVLFAYYRKKMETAGALTFTGYKLWGKGDGVKKAKKSKKTETPAEAAAA